MSKTFSELKTSVEDKTGTSTETGRHLNRAQLELAKVSKKRKRSENVTVTDGVASIPADCLIITGVAWGGIPLESYPGEEKPDYGSGTPMYWMIDGNNIIFIPKTTGSKGQFIYIEKPTDMSADDDTAHFDNSDDALIAFAIWQIYHDAEYEEEALYWQQKWLDELAGWANLDALKNKRSRRVRRRAYV